MNNNINNSIDGEQYRYNGAEGFMHLGSPPETQHTVEKYPINLKNQDPRVSPTKMERLAKGITHIVSLLHGIVNPLQGAVQYGVNKARHEMSRNMLASSAEGYKTQEEIDKRKAAITTFLTNNQETEIERFTVPITNKDKTRLDGMIIKNPIATDYLVVFQPNEVHYEEFLEEAKTLGQELQKNIVLFNYRGVGESTGEATKAKDLVNDGKAICQMLVTYKDVQPEHITLYGHSLGGGVATAIAARNPGLNLIIDRSFTKLSEAAKEIVIRKKENRILGTIVKHLTGWLGWELNTEKTLTRIRNKVLILSTPNDETLVASALKPPAEQEPINIHHHVLHFDPRSSNHHVRHPASPEVLDALRDKVNATFANSFFNIDDM